MVAKTLRTFLPLGIVFALAASLPASGSTFLPMSVGELTAASDVVVEGKVVRVDSSWNPEHTMIFTEAEVVVDHVHRGQAGHSVTVRTAGGTADGYTIWADGFPVLAEGESVLLFLSAESGAFRITGYQYGHYRLEPDALGRMIAMPTVGEPAGSQGLGELQPLRQPLDELREEILDPSHEPALRRTAEPFVLLSPARTWDWSPTYVVDNRGLPSINDGDGGVTRTVNALTSTQAWNIACLAVAGSVSGFTLGDGIPMLNFRDPLNVCTGSCLAATFTGFFSDRGNGTYRIDDADIVFNSGGVEWTSEGEDPLGAGCSSEMYVESVAVHEVGHGLGLAHTNVSGATMFPSASFCNNSRATTEADDQGGLNALYGGGLGCLGPVRVLRGIDLWTTPDDGTSVLEVTFPQGFFCNGESDWFQRQIPLRGLPITTNPAGVLGNTDTVIERLTDATFESVVANAKLVIRALSLQSSSPVSVDCPDRSREEWDMYVRLYCDQAQGSITITLDPSGESGEFDAVVPVSAQLNFVNVATGKTVGPLIDSQTLVSKGQPWLSEPGPGGVTYSSSVQIDTDQDDVPDLMVPGMSSFAPNWKLDPITLDLVRIPLPHGTHVPEPPLQWCVAPPPSTLTTSEPCATP